MSPRESRQVKVHYARRHNFNNQDPKMPVVKVQFDGITRLCQADSFRGLMQYCTTNGSAALRYEDEEGDIITCSTEQEFSEALKVMACTGTQRLPKFEVLDKQLKEKEKEQEKEKEKEKEMVHDRVFCDECERTAYITGVRFKCTKRPDFDLCGACEARRPQPYPMLKIYSPVQAPAEIRLQVWPSNPCRPAIPTRKNPQMAPHMRKLLTNAAGMSMFPGRGRSSRILYCGRQLGVSNIPGSDGRCGPSNGPQCADCADVQRREQSAQQATGDQTFEAAVESISVRTDCPEAKSESTTTAATSALDAEFVGDITFAAGSTVLCGASLIKTWSLRNIGTNPWPERTAVAHLANSQCPGLEIQHAIAPGETAELSVRLVAPMLPGHFTETFRLMTPTGVYFGPDLVVDLNISDDDEDTGGWQVLSASMFSDSDQITSENALADPQDDPVKVDDAHDSSLWSEEIALLSEMGFTDLRVVLPILRKYVQVPAACTDAAQHRKPHSERIQDVVCALLSEVPE